MKEHASPDIHNMIKKLEQDYEFSPRQAEGIIIILTELFKETSSDLVSTNEITKIETQLERRIIDLKNEIANAKPDIFKWIIPMILTIIGLMITMYESLRVGK
jgi:hypothetical protein